MTCCVPCPLSVTVCMRQSVGRRSRQNACCGRNCLQIFYSIRSERLLMEQLDYNLLFRWFVGLPMEEPGWTPTVFTKNRDGMLNQDIARSFFRRVVERAHGLMSDEHFTVDGTFNRGPGQSEELPTEG